MHSIFVDPIHSLSTPKACTGNSDSWASKALLCACCPVLKSLVFSPKNPYRTPPMVSSLHLPALWKIPVLKKLWLLRFPPTTSSPFLSHSSWRSALAFGFFCMTCLEVLLQYSHWMGCYSITGLPVSLGSILSGCHNNSLVSIYTPRKW